MAKRDEQTDRHTPRVLHTQATPAAVGMHVGLAIVCGSAVYTGWQRSIVTLPQWALMLILAATLLGIAFSRRPGIALRAWARGALALAGLLVLRLCYEPQLDSFARLGEELPEAFLMAYPGIALVGIVIAFASWLLYVGGGGLLPLGTIPARRSAFLATGLMVAFAAFCHFMLHGPHDLYLADTLRPILGVLQAGCLTVVLLSIGGGPGVRKAPHIYVAVTLIAAFIRNMAFPM